MPTPLPPLPGHAIFLLLIQLALLIVVARAGAELVKRVGLPSVVGELMAGIVLGPSVFGHYAPAAFAVVFPREALQFQLLEMMGTLGMVLLLLLTGFETDLRLLKNLGRAALVASIAGMIVPFAMGYGLGQWMPASALAQPAERAIFSAFLATAMAISAMPVIAKILMDLDLTRRDIGVVILSAGVIDDTVGWLCLSVIAGAATTGAVRLSGLGVTLASIAGFLLVMAVVVYPLTRLAVRGAARMRSENADLVLVVVLTFLAAAVTERIGVHAVFGAFVTGALLKQVPELRHETIHKLEQFILAILAPVFFGIVGLKVNVWALGDGRLLGIVLGVACLGKLVGCLGGSLWGGLRFWEALSIAIAMNTRGAMELVVASIGLSLGILTEQMFSVIVMVAVITSLLAPLLLRLTIPRVRLTEEEARRIHAETSKGAFDPAHLRLLLPTSGGANAVEAARLVVPLAERSGSPVAAIHVERSGTFWQRLLRPFRKRARAIEEHLDTLRGLGAKVRRLTAAGVTDGVLAEAGHGYDLLVLGASSRGSTVGGQVLPEIVAGAPCHVAIVRAAASPRDIRRVLVPVDGTMAGRVAAELACRFAEASGAELTLAVLADHRPRALPPFRQDSRPTAPPPLAVPPEEQVDRISPVFRGSTVKPRILHLDDDPAASALLSEVIAGAYDLVVLGAENRAIRHRLFLGRQSHRILRESPTTVMVVVPNVARLA